VAHCSSCLIFVAVLSNGGAVKDLRINAKYIDAVTELENAYKKPEYINNICKAGF